MISDNVWPMPTILEYADGGINYVGDREQRRCYKTPAEWEAYSPGQERPVQGRGAEHELQDQRRHVSAGADMKRAANFPCVFPAPERVH